jgi:hypothetical protein
MSLIVPWTEPGGVSCCCINCPEDANADAALAFGNTGGKPLVEVPLTEEQYAALTAGGTWRAQGALDYSFVRSRDDGGLSGYELVSSASLSLDVEFPNTFGVPFPTSIWPTNTTGISFECLRPSNGGENKQFLATETLQLVETQLSETALLGVKIILRLYDIAGVKFAKVLVEFGFSVFWNFSSTTISPTFQNVTLTFSAVGTSPVNSFLGTPMTASTVISLGGLGVTESASASGSLIITHTPSAP